MRRNLLRVAPDAPGGRAVRPTIRALADAAARWRDADYPPRVRVTHDLIARTAYTEPVVDYALDRLFDEIDAGALTGVIARELGCLEALDGFVPRDGGRDAHAAPVGRVAIVASDTTIGVALWPALFALCAGCDVAVRDRSDALLLAFAETLAEEDAAVAARLRVHVYPAHDDGPWAEALGRADAVVAFGGDDALRAIRQQSAADARFIAFGHRTSATYVTREDLADERTVRDVAHGVARDALLYDGEGCLSSHAVFIERGADVPSFGRAVVAACERLAVEFPPGPDQTHAATIAERDAARFRASLTAGTVTWLPVARCLIVVDPPEGRPPPLAPRTLAIYPVDGPDDFVQFVGAHALPLEAVAVPTMPPRQDVARAIVVSGAARIARAGSLQIPSLRAEHGGIGRIVPFVRWVTRDG